MSTGFPGNDYVPTHYVMVPRQTLLGARPLAVYSDFNFLLLSVFQRLVVVVVAIVVLEMSGLEQRKRTMSAGGS